MKQELFYPLYKKFEKEFFIDICKAIENKYTFIGNENDRIFFVKCLLCFQMIKGYRMPLAAIKENLCKETDLRKINDIIKSQEFAIDYSWAVFKHEREMGKFAKKLSISALKLLGSHQEFDEFVLRYLISIWMVAWEGPLYAILKSSQEGKLNLKEMNQVLSSWDFTNIFDR